MNDDCNVTTRAETSKPHAAIWPKILATLFASEGIDEQFITAVHFNAPPQAVWDEMMFYEEAPGTPPLLLRAFMPYPIRTEGAKSHVGAIIHCIYQGGDLIKHVSLLDPPHLICFEVVQQRLGIEGCAVALTGSYELRDTGDGTDLLLTTNCRTFLHPRWLFRTLENIITGQLHHHILKGMRAALQQEPAIPV